MQSMISKINAGLADFLEYADRKYGLKRANPRLYRHCRSFILRGGKRIRPLLFVLAYKGYSRCRRTPPGLFTAAASAELLHDYMLIHDDVIDKSSLRRGKPTLHRLLEKKGARGNTGLGSSLAVVAGDIIFALAVEAFLAVREDSEHKEKALAKFIEAATSTGLGEFLDVVASDTSIETIKEKDVLLIYTLKTARYSFECPLLAGALLAGAPQRELRKLSQLGLAAGRAFQILDDFLDIFSTEKTTGKSILTDLAESKKTLLCILAFRNLAGEKKNIFKNILEKKNIKKSADLEKFRGFIVESGAYKECLDRMKTLQKEALSFCGKLRMKESSRIMLERALTKTLSCPF